MRPPALCLRATALAAMAKFWLQTQVCFVTWCKSRVRDPRRFFALLKGKMPVDTQVFGCREYHRSGELHYHAVICFADEVRWSNALPYFHLRPAGGDVDTFSVHIKVPTAKQDVEQFLHTTQRYCTKNLNTDVFGRRIIVPESLRAKPVHCNLCKQRGFVTAQWACERCSRPIHGITEKVM